MSNLKRFWYRLKAWWMKFAYALGWVNTRILLTLFYILLGIPAVILKLMRKDLLDRSFSSAPTYWKDKETSRQTIEQSRHQF